MAEFKVIPLDKIFAPERLRAVEEDVAFVIAQSIERIGLLNPITVRATPRAERPYTLVAGAHRLRGTELAGKREIDAIIVKADKVDAELAEIEENIFRNELSALDRAIFVRRYREIWEEKNGKIDPKGGRPAGNSAKLTEFPEDSAQSEFFRRVSDRMGLSRRAVERSQFIGKGLDPELRKSLRGTPVADNQSQLLKLAKMEPARQKKIAVAFADQPDIARAIELTDPHAKARATATAQQELLSRLISTWARADDKTKAAFLEHAGATVRAKREKMPKLSELITEIEGGGHREPGPASGDDLRRDRA